MNFILFNSKVYIFCHNNKKLKMKSLNITVGPKLAATTLDVTIKYFFIRIWLQDSMKVSHFEINSFLAK